MKDFWYYVPTRVNFGPSCFQYLVDTIHQWGTKPLIVYGGGSIKRNGAYDAVVSRLKEAGIPYAEMGGVAPNPRYESVLEGNRICREEKCDILLPIGGASAIDCAKSIAATVNYDGEPWDIISKKVPVGKLLPIIAGPPLAALWRDLRDAGRFLTREQPGLLRVLALVALLNLFLSALLVVGLPYLVKISLGLSSLHYSFAEAALSLGSIVGGLLSGLVLRGADIRRAWRFLLGTSLLLLPMALALALGIPSLAAYGVILVSVLLGMACAMLFTVSAQTYLQRATPPHLLGKVASFVAAISTCAMPLGQALYGLLFDALQAHVWVVVALGMGASLLVTFSSVRALGRLPALDEAPSGGYTEQSLDS